MNNYYGKEQQNSQQDIPEDVNPSREHIDIPPLKEDSEQYYTADIQSSDLITKEKFSLINGDDPYLSTNSFIVFKTSKTLKKIRSYLKKMTKDRDLWKAYINEIIMLLDDSRKYFYLNMNSRILYGFLDQIFQQGYWEELSIQQITTIHLQMGRLINNCTNRAVIDTFVEKLIEKGINPQPFITEHDEK